MDIEEALKVADYWVEGQTGKPLKGIERALIRGSLKDWTYEEIKDKESEARNYQLSYMKQEVAPELWKRLTSVLREAGVLREGERVNKHNLWEPLERALKRYAAERDKEPLPNVLSPVGRDDKDLKRADDKGVGAARLRDWGEAPDASGLCGRTGELATLKEWAVLDRCRLVAILGMGGIGKTVLSVKLAQLVQAEFEFVIWRSLRNAPPPEEILAGLIQSLSGAGEMNSPTGVAGGISQLLECLRTCRCLLVFDDWETVLRGGDLAGRYREGYEGYGELLRRVGESPHQSCLVLASRERPQEFSFLAGSTFPVRAMPLTGLQGEEARGLLQAMGLSGSDTCLQELIQRYGGNPFALKLVSTTIQELFNGNVLSFLEQSTFLVGDILTDLLRQQFSRLPELAKEIVCWLALEPKPVSPAQLKANIWLPVALSELLINLESLSGRSLIEKIPDSRQVLFTLQPVVRKYVTRQLAEGVCKDIFAFSETQDIEALGLLRSLGLGKTQEGDEKLKATQVRLILQPIKEKLGKIFRGERSLEDRLNDMLLLLEEKPPQAVGYAAANVRLLLGGTESGM